jgi:hypothetical protein
MSMKKSSDNMGNGTLDLPVCGAVPQPLRHRVLPFISWAQIIIIAITSGQMMIHLNKILRIYFNIIHSLFNVHTVHYQTH